MEKNDQQQKSGGKGYPPMGGQMPKQNTRANNNKMNTTTPGVPGSVAERGYTKNGKL